MKCSRCAGQIEGVCYLVARVDQQADTYMGNFCRDCTIAMFGSAGRNRLDAVLSRTGWIQPPLSGFEFYVRVEPS